MKKQFPLSTRLASLILVFFSLCHFNAAAQIGNCESPISIDNMLNGNPANFPTSTALEDLLDPDCLSNNQYKLWFKFTALGPDFQLSSICNNTTCEVALFQFEADPCDFPTANLVKCNNVEPTLELVNLLTTGETYYLIFNVEKLTASIEFSIINLPVITNDEVCDAVSLVPDGSCVIGSTSFATQDFINPTSNCDESLFAQSVWYKTILTSGKNTLDIDLKSLSLTGDVAVLVGTLNNCESEELIIEKAYCGIPEDFSVFGLESGQTYYIEISTTTDEAGNFELCLAERGPPIGCAQNDNCQPGHSGPQKIIIDQSNDNCIAGCNIGASPGKNFGGTSCFDAYGPTVWYTYQPEEAEGLLYLSLSNSTLANPQIAIFEANDCENFFLLDCSNQNAISTYVYEGLTYLIAVSGANDEEGSFNLCPDLIVNNGTECNFFSEIQIANTSMGSPAEGPFLPGEEVEVCLIINQYFSNDNTCQWLHGIVPTFGAGWDSASFANNGMPLNITNPLFPTLNQQAVWQWEPSGRVLYNEIQPAYNFPGEPVGAGWFVSGVVQNNTNGCFDFQDPNCSWGDGISCNESGGFWAVCFTLTTADNDCGQEPSFNDCSIAFRTYSDGETGGWNDAGCQADLAWKKALSVTCCDAPCTDCSSAGLDASNEWIADVNFNSFSNPSDAAGYTDFTDQVIDLLTGTSNNFTLTPGYSDQAYNQFWSIWIDFNGDGDFEDTGEEVYANAALGGPVSGSITLPLNVVGTRTMRVAMSFDEAPLPCRQFAYGEVEDYTVKFDACMGTIPSSVQYQGDDVRISWETITDASRYLIIYRDPSLGNAWTPIPTFDPTVLLTNLVANKTYEYHLRTRCPNGWTDWSDRYYFTTDDTSCNRPTPFGVTPIGNDVVQMQINSLMTAETYRVRYRALGDTDWIVIISLVEQFTIEGIQTSQIYEYQLGSFCQNTWSNYSATHRFTINGSINRIRLEEEVISDSFTVFPNPSDGRFTVQFSNASTPQYLGLYSLDGKKIKTFEFSNTTTEDLDFSQLEVGIYLLRWQDQNQTQTKKIIITR
ncbi:MAG: GEVED domain-containing protein [Saprospiraceae bacterium]